MSQSTLEALLAISNAEVVPGDVLGRLIEKMPVVEEANPAWGLVLEDTTEYKDIDACLDSVLENIKSAGHLPREAGLLLRIAVYNQAFTFTGVISPRQGFVDYGIAIELSVYPTDLIEAESP